MILIPDQRVLDLLLTSPSPLTPRAFSVLVCSV